MLDASHYDPVGIRGDSEEGNVGAPTFTVFHGGQVSCIVAHADDAGGAFLKAPEKPKL